MKGPGLFLDPADADVLQRIRKPRVVLFLDRDGVMNEDDGYVHRVEQTRWLPGIFELCANAHALRLPIVIVTNQAGIARGLYSEQDFLDYTRWMHGQFSQRGTPLLATLYCPHHPDAGVGRLTTVCGCRKPAPGMILDAAERFSVDLPRSILVGNRDSDMQAARSAGVGRRVLLDAGPHSGVANAATERVGSLSQLDLSPAGVHMRNIEGAAS